MSSDTMYNDLVDCFGIAALRRNLRGGVVVQSKVLVYAVCQYFPLRPREQQSQTIKRDCRHHNTSALRSIYDFWVRPNASAIIDGDYHPVIEDYASYDSSAVGAQQRCSYIYIYTIIK